MWLLTGKLLVVQKIQKTWMKLENLGSFIPAEGDSYKHRNDCSVLEKDKVMVEILKYNSPHTWLSVHEEDI